MLPKNCFISCIMVGFLVKSPCTSLKMFYSMPSKWLGPHRQPIAPLLPSSLPPPLQTPPSLAVSHFAMIRDTCVCVCEPVHSHLCAHLIGSMYTKPWQRRPTSTFSVLCSINYKIFPCVYIIVGIWYCWYTSLAVAVLNFFLRTKPAP